MFGSLEKPIKSVRELNMEPTCFLSIPDDLLFTKRCSEFMAKLEGGRDHVKQQVNLHQNVPDDWKSVLKLVEQITELFGMISNVAEAVQNDQLRVMSDPSILQSVWEGLTAADHRVAEAMSLQTSSGKDTVDGAPVAANALS